MLLLNTSLFEKYSIVVCLIFFVYSVSDKLSYFVDRKNLHKLHVIVNDILGLNLVGWIRLCTSFITDILSCNFNVNMYQLPIQIWSFPLYLLWDDTHKS